MTFVRQHPEIFPPGVFLAVPGDLNFWSKVGGKVTGIGSHEVLHSRAELLPQSPLYECLVADAIAMAEFPVETPLQRWLVEQGFLWQGRLNPIDGGQILQWSPRDCTN